MPLPHARMIHIGRRVYRFHTTALALAGLSAMSKGDLKYLPLGLGDGKALAGKRYMLWADRPSSTDNVLSFVSTTSDIERADSSPMDPQTSPLSCLMFKIR